MSVCALVPSRCTFHQYENAIKVWQKACLEVQHLISEPLQATKQERFKKLCQH